MFFRHLFKPLLQTSEEPKRQPKPGKQTCKDNCDVNNNLTNVTLALNRRDRLELGDVIICEINIFYLNIFIPYKML